MCDSTVIRYGTNCMTWNDIERTFFSEGGRESRKEKGYQGVWRDDDEDDDDDEPHHHHHHHHHELLSTAKLREDTHTHAVITISRGFVTPKYIGRASDGCST